MTTPTIGLPRLEPIVMALPCQPMASPRAISGTRREIASPVAAMLGAIPRPDMKHRMKAVGRFDTSAMGMVTIDSQKSTHSG